MFTKKTNLTRTNTNLDNFMDGYDQYNSKLLLYLLDPDLERWDFTITTQKYRPDLIALDFYGDIKYQDYVIQLCCLPLGQYIQGRTIKLVPPQVLKSIIGDGGK